MVRDQPELSGEGPTAEMLRTILAAVSQFELSLIRDRMSEGIGHGVRAAKED